MYLTYPSCKILVKKGDFFLCEGAGQGEIFVQWLKDNLIMTTV